MAQDLGIVLIEIETFKFYVQVGQRLICYHDLDGILTLYTAAAAVTLLICDYLQTLGEEVSKIWFTTKLSLGKILFLMSRYTALIDAPLMLLVQTNRGLLSPSSCLPLKRLTNLSSFLGVAASEAILFVSLSVLLGSQRSYNITLAAIYVGGFLACLALVVYLAVTKAARSPLPGLDCVYISPSESFDGVAICYCILLAGELCIAVLGVTVGFKDFLRTKSSLARTMYRDGTWYYITLLGLSTLNVAAPYTKPHFLYPTTIVWQRILHSVLASRLFLNMRPSAPNETTDIVSTHFEFRRRDS
ncbi:hypothetical protein CC2G_004886 [Coprinopsis cinerea AmutBmut pab1-1]|nr:hypothetical protein CC2G_004886 [Coprinopsis cinerea AmutBmut pab1-1]